MLNHEPDQLSLILDCFSNVVLPCSTKFLRVLIFMICAIFPAIHKNKFLQIKITANIFPAKIYSRVDILFLKFTTQKFITKKLYLFNYNLSLSFRSKMVYNKILVYCLKICISISKIGVVSRDIISME